MVRLLVIESKKSKDDLVRDRRPHFLRSNRPACQTEKRFPPLRRDQSTTCQPFSSNIFGYFILFDPQCLLTCVILHERSLKDPKPQNLPQATQAFTPFSTPKSSLNHAQDTASTKKHAYSSVIQYIRPKRPSISFAPKDLYNPSHLGPKHAYLFFAKKKTPPVRCLLWLFRETGLLRRTSTRTPVCWPSTSLPSRKASPVCRSTAPRRWGIRAEGGRG